MLAVSRGRLEMVELFLESGANINAADDVRILDVVAVVSVSLYCYFISELVWLMIPFD